MVNPQIIDHSEKIVNDWEWCLSIPIAEPQEARIYGKVPRYESITVTHQDEYWNIILNTYHDLVARIIQHEIDHLDGKLFIDTVDMMTLCSYEEYIKQI